MNRFINTFALFVSLTAFPIASQAQGKACWQLEPFDDVLKLTVTQPKANLAFFILQDVVWNGLDVYELEGGGDGVLHSSGEFGVISLTIHNPSTFFGGNPVCRFHAHVENPSLIGPWAVECMRTGPNNPPFTQSGNLLPITCEDMVIQSFSNGPLAGE